MSHLTIMNLFLGSETTSNRFLMPNYSKLVKSLKFWAIFMFYTDFDNSVSRGKNLQRLKKFFKIIRFWPCLC